MRKDILLPTLAVAGGGAGFALRYWQIATAFDEEKLLFRSGAPATLVLLGVLGWLAVLTALLVRGDSAPEEYRQAFFCPSSGYMTLMAAGSFLMFAAAALGLLEAREQMELWRMNAGVSFPAMMLVTVVLCIPGGVAGLMLGKGNYRNTLPEFYPVLATLPAYAVLPWVVALYQANSRQPEPMLFVFSLVGVVCVALGLYGSASFAFGRPRPKLCLFFSLMGVVLLLTSLADRPGRFYAVMSLACVLLLLAQSYALLRSAFGPPCPKRQENSPVPPVDAEHAQHE